MKKIIIAAVSSLCFITNAFSLETTVKELNQLLKDKITSDKRLSLDDVKGEWLSTYFQPQIFPGSCNPDRKETISLALHDAWKKLIITPAKGRKLEPVILSKVEDFPMGENGSAEILGEVLIIHSYINGSFGGPVDYYCSTLDELVTDTKALLCFQPFGEDLSTPCGWYSFFIRE